MSSAMPAGRVVDRSASSRIIYVEALEQQRAQLELVFGPPVVGCFRYSVVSYPLSPRSRFTSLEKEGETEGPAKVTPLRVVIALRSTRGLGTVLLGSEPKPEEEAVFIWK
nr:hypothetical protein [Tanacetum cinerariifolium]